jgi:hypothetical protein
VIAPNNEGDAVSMFVAGEMRYTTDSALASYADQFGATITHCDLGGTDQIDIEDLRTLPPTAAELQTQDTKPFGAVNQPDLRPGRHC